MRLTILPTPKAIVLAATAAVSAWAGALLGVFALFAFALGLGALLVLGLVSVLHGGLRSWKINRVLNPAPARVGVPVRVEITATPVKRFAPSVALFEPTPWGTRRLGLSARMSRLEPLRVTWSLSTPARGLLTAGPGLLFRHDLLSLFRRRVAELPETHVVVHPLTVPITTVGLRRFVGVDAVGPAEQLEPGDMRAYVPGDDPRRVNWKASARTMSSGSLIVVDQKPTGRESDICVMLELDHLPASIRDPESGAATGSRELAISVAASMVVELTERSNSPAKCELRVTSGTRTIHRSFDRQENLDALALIESIERAGTSVMTDADERDPTIRSIPSKRAVLVTGPTSTKTGRATFRCAGDDAIPAAVAADRVEGVYHLTTLEQFSEVLDSL
jgi:uncharacterized protein (DUF58 family)